jgi:mutator protein MutT
MHLRFPDDQAVLVRVVAAVIERDGRYLLCKRPPHKRHGGMWEFPGGKIEEGESDLDAASRELTEELGVKVLSVAPPRFRVADPGSHFVIEFMRVEIDGSPQCIEHSEVRWVSLSELPHFDLAPSDRRFVEHLLTSDA